VILLDSNIIIYLRDPEWGEKIAGKLHDERLATCNVVIAEVLGYKHLEAADAQFFERLFASMKNHSFNDMVVKRVIELRKTETIQLPDAIIAATAITNDLTLWTHNTEDFDNIPGLRFVDPLSAN